MTTPRRRLVRPEPALRPDEAARQRQLQRLHARLAQEQACLARWMARLRRAFHTVEKTQARLGRLQRQINQRQT